jgi:transcriptional regulator with XRE-family HTH domain
MSEDTRDPPRVTLSTATEVRGLREWRRVRYWTQLDLAAASGLSLSVVSGIERRWPHAPSLSTMREVARALGVGITQVREFAEAMDRERDEDAGS